MLRWRGGDTGTRRRCRPRLASLRLSARRGAAPSLPPFPAPRSRRPPPPCVSAGGGGGRCSPAPAPGGGGGPAAPSVPAASRANRREQWRAERPPGGGRRWTAGLDQARVIARRGGEPGPPPFLLQPEGEGGGGRWGAALGCPQPFFPLRGVGSAVPPHPAEDRFPHAGFLVVAPPGVSKWPPRGFPSGTAAPRRPAPTAPPRLQLPGRSQPATGGGKGGWERSLWLGGKHPKEVKIRG